MKRIIIIALMAASTAIAEEQFANRTVSESDSKEHRGLDLRLDSESNLVSMATAFGISTRPVPMVEVKHIINGIAETNILSALFLSQTLQAEVLTYTLNGGDIWNIGSTNAP